MNTLLRRLVFVVMALAWLWGGSYFLHLQGDDWWGNLPGIVTIIYGSLGLLVFAFLIESELNDVEI